MPAPTIEEVIKKYRELKAELDKARASWKEEEEHLKGKIERLSMWLRDKADELGVNSFNTDYGTAYRSEKVYVRIANWDEFIKYAIDTGNYQLLEKRVAKRAALDLMNAENLNPEDIGLEHSTDVDFLVRKPSARK